MTLIPSPEPAPATGAAPRRLGLDLWLDIACPWCVIGELRLERVLSRLPFAAQIDVRFHAYQLQPDAPERATMKQPEYLASRGMDMARFRPAQRQLVAMGAELGFHFDQDQAVPSNTRTAHRLIQAAAGSEAQRALVAVLFSGYFERGADIGDPAVLRAAAAEAGLPAELAERVLADPAEGLAAVEADLRGATALGITGVPFLLLGGRSGVAGAQSEAAIEAALTAAYAELNPSPVLLPLAGAAAGEVCGPDGCAR